MPRGILLGERAVRQQLLLCSLIIGASSCGSDSTTAPRVFELKPSMVTAPLVVANPGGPYTGVEGTAISFDGTASQGVGLKYNWDFGDGTPHDTGAIVTHVYVDNKTYTVKLFVTDANNVKSTTAQTTATIANAPPVVQPFNAPSPAPRVGVALVLTTSFTDPGTADTHSGTFQWGDTKSSPATVKEAKGSGTVTGSHTYTTVGTYTVTLRVADDNGGADTVTLQFDVGPANHPPKAAVGGPYMGIEGAPVTFDGSASSDPDSDSLTYDWDFGDGTPHGAGQTPTHTYADNKTYTVRLVVTDPYGAKSPAAQTTATIANAAPVIDSLTGPATPPIAGQPTTVHATFTDPGTLDTHSANLTWGDGSTSPGTVSQSAGKGTVTASHSYATGGEYLVTLVVKDNAGAADTATLSLKVSAGYVAVTSNTLGADLDPDGYTVTLDSGTAKAVTQSVPTNGTTTFEFVAAGAHTVTLSGLAANCSIGTTRQPVTVTAGAIAQVQFSVFCIALHAATYTFVGAGDIADCTRIDDSVTANVLDQVVAADPTTIVYTIGDNAYESATATELATCYGPTWGRHKVRTFATLGNHEYKIDPNPTWDYFGSRAGPRGLGYYSFNLGDYWHVIVLNDNEEYGGPARTAGSAQDTWLQHDLATNTRPCTIAIWHQPYVASDFWLSASRRIFWDRLYAAGAEIVLDGHLHTYEREAPQTPDLVRDDAHGIRQFIVGTGGASTYTPDSLRPNTEAVAPSRGVLKLTLGPGTYNWEFVWAKGQTFSDSGSGTCH